MIAAAYLDAINRSVILQMLSLWIASDLKKNFQTTFFQNDYNTFRNSKHRPRNVDIDSKLSIVCHVINIAMDHCAPPEERARAMASSDGSGGCWSTK